MPAYFESGFMVREPAWHGMGVVLENYPGRDEAMRLAGHDFVIVERPVAVVGHKGFKVADNWKALVKAQPGDASHGEIMHITRESYGTVQNDVCWDIVDQIVNQPNVKYESGGVLKGGAMCWVLAWLDEPVTIYGDNSPILPFVAVVWSHDGTAAIKARSTSVRIVCANTEAASEAQAKKAGTDFTFRHTKNVMQQIEDAKMALQGVRAGHEEYIALAEELAHTPITAHMRELFITEFLPMPPDAMISDRVARNVTEARLAVQALFNGPTIPEAHQFTAYGLQLAGVEYLDHIRGYRDKATYLGRTMLRQEPAKVKLTQLIREVVKA